MYLLRLTVVNGYKKLWKTAIFAAVQKKKNTFDSMDKDGYNEEINVCLESLKGD